MQNYGIVKHCQVDCRLDSVAFCKCCYGPRGPENGRHTAAPPRGAIRRRGGDGRDCVHGLRRRPSRAMLPPVCCPFVVDVGVTEERARGAPAGLPTTLGGWGMGVPFMPDAGTTLTHDRHRRPLRSPIRCQCHGRGLAAAQPYGGCRLVLVASVRARESKHASTRTVSAGAGEKVPLCLLSRFSPRGQSPCTSELIFSQGSARTHSMTHPLRHPNRSVRSTDRPHAAVHSTPTGAYCARHSRPHIHIAAGGAGLQHGTLTPPRPATSVAPLL